MNIFKKKILIFGSNGFFGKNLKNLLECIDYDMFFFDRNNVDVLNREKLHDVFDSLRPSIVINCCGKVGSSESNKKLNQTDIFNTNMILNTNIFECCNKFQVEKIIVFSTYRIFMKNTNTNSNSNSLEECIYDSFFPDLQNNNIGYLMSKATMDNQIKLLINETNIKISCLILPNIFGCFDNFCENGRIIASLIYKIYNAKLKNQPLFIDSNSETLVNIIFINDIIDIVKKCIYTDINCNIIILNPEGTITLRELTQKLSVIMNFNNTIFFNNLTKHPNQIDGIFINAKLINFEKYFHNFTFTSVSLALQLTVNYFIRIEKEKKREREKEEEEEIEPFC